MAEKKKREGKVDNIKAHNFDVMAADRQRAIASKGGKASQAKRKEMKTMREYVKMIAYMDAQGNAKAALEAMGIASGDQTNIAAVVLKLYQKAMSGDVMAIRLLQDMLGESFTQIASGFEQDANIIDMPYPQINLPDNGRDTPPGNIIAPQAGPQTMFLASKADIVIYGGAAGGGKSYALLLEGLRHKDVKGFDGVIFRKNFNQITAAGGLWDTSLNIYNMVQGAEAKKTPSLHWEFAGGGKVGFAYVEREEDLMKWQGTQICYLAFDELTHFTKHQFTYLFSRNRSTCGVRPYIRGTCNPDADSWVADFISWWIDQDTGYPIKERSGQIRYLVMLNDTFCWADTIDELVTKYNVNPDDCKSVTFIASRLEDNKILMQTDPGYMANLKAMTEIDRERLLMGNWKIKAAAGRFFKRTQVEVISAVPTDIVQWCRAWDLAATDEDADGDPDYTAGVLMGRRKGGTMVILDVINQRIKAGEVERLVLNTSATDRAKYGLLYRVRMCQDPGQAGKSQAQQYIKALVGYDVKILPASGPKEVRATPLAAQWQNGNIQVLAAAWNDEYFGQMESFPESKHDDMVDASSDSFSELAEGTFDIDSLL